MLAKRNDSIKNAYEILQKVSKNKEARMAYEARQAEIMDQMTREKSARKEGRKEGIEEVARNLLLIGLDIEKVMKVTGLTEEEIKSIK